MHNGASRFAPLQTGGPSVISESFTNEVRDGSATGALYAWPNAFPSDPNTVTISSATSYSVDYREAQTHNYNLTPGREVLPNWGLQLSYRGVLNRELLWSRTLNSIPTSDTPWSKSRLPYPNLSSIGFVENGASSWYQSLEWILTHPWVKGLYSALSFTKQWSGGLYPGIGNFNDQAIVSPEYSFDRDRDRVAMAAEWPSHDFLCTFVGDLPVGCGQRSASSPNKVLNAFIGNWSFSGAFSWRSGLGFTPSWSWVDFSNTGRFGAVRT